MSFTDIEIGGIKPGNCFFCGSGKDGNGCNSLYGPEYTFSHEEGPCGVCGFNCVGTACTVGTKTQCKKIQYTGNKTQCCLGLPPTGYPSSTCDPDFNPISDTCFNTLANFCSIGDNIFKNSACKLWAIKNPENAFSIKKTFCNPSLIGSNQDCRNFVINSSGKLDDTMVANYCQTNPNDDLCSCISSEIPCPNKFDTNCIKKGGYKTTDMSTVTCPNILNCNQFLTLSPGAQAVATNVEQNCNSDPNKPVSTPVPTSTSLNIFNNKLILIFLLFLIIIIISIIIIFYRNNGH